tara:strand:- start:178 stop:879 length:702 start_codon:yes stop_codon:yes gene_type:complete
MHFKPIQETKKRKTEAGPQEPIPKYIEMIKIFIQNINKSTPHTHPAPQRTSSVPPPFPGASPIVNMPARHPPHTLRTISDNNDYLKNLIMYLKDILKELSCRCGDTGIKLMGANIPWRKRMISMAVYLNGSPTGDINQVPIEYLNYELEAALKITRNRLFIPPQPNYGLLLELENDRLALPFPLRQSFTVSEAEATNALLTDHQQEDYGKTIDQSRLQEEKNHIDEEIDTGCV